MSPHLLAWLSVVGAGIACMAGAGARSLHHFSRGELRDYCRRRNRSDVFVKIVAQHKPAAMAAEMIQYAGVAIFLVSWAIYVGSGNSAIALWQWAGVVVSGVAAMLVLSVWIPVAAARMWSAPFLFHTWRMWRWSSLSLWPLHAAFQFVDAIASRLAGRDEETYDEEEAFEEEVRAVLSAGLRDGLLENDAGEMIEGVIELGDSDVSDIMTPRSLVDALDVNSSWDEIMEFVIRVRRTRIPVYEQNLDNIVGVLYVKDLLPELAKRSQELRQPLVEIIRPAAITTGSRRLDELLRDFRATRNHLAIVIDEYQSFTGVVTIEDVLEEIVGEIVDEFDAVEDQEVRRIDETTYEALGGVHLDELNDAWGLGLPEPEDYDTIGGFVMAKLQDVPRVGAVVNHNDVRITVLAASRRHVEKVRIERIDRAELESA